MDRMKPSRTLLLSGLGVLALIYAAWGLCDTLTELGGDSATYMLMGRALSPFVAPDPNLAAAVAGSTYPPLFPLLIGLLGGSFVAAHAIVIAALVLSFGLLYRLLRAQGFDTAMAAVAVLLFAAMPGTYLLALNIWSENAYLALSLLALLALESEPRDDFESGSHRWWIAAIAAAAAIMVRTAGLPLLATFSLFTVRGRPRHWPWLIVAAWLPFLAWMLVSRLRGGGGGQYAQQLVAQYGHDPLGHLYTQLQVEFHALGYAWLTAWLGFAAPPSLILLVQAFGVLCIAGCLLRLVHGYVDACYVVLYLLMLLIWPWPGEAPRLLYVILPLVLACGLQIVQSLAVALPGSTGVIRTALIVMLALPLLPGVLVTAKQRLAPAPAGLEVIRHIAGYYGSDPFEERYTAYAQARIIGDLRTLSTVVPPQDCIFQIKAPVAQLLSDRRSIAPPLPATDDRSFAQQIGQCRYAYLMALRSPTFPAAYYPRERLSPQYHVIRQLPDDFAPGGGVLAELIELPSAQPTAQP
jgi:hypothetical protein